MYPCTCIPDAGYFGGSGLYRRFLWTESAGSKSSTEDRADVRRAIYGRDGEDPVAGEKGAAVQSECGLSDGRADGCGTDFGGEGAIPGLHGCSLHQHDL